MAAYRAYKFVATTVGQNIPLVLHIDCGYDMEASLVALSLVSREHAVDVWINDALIYQAPAIGHTETADLPLQLMQSGVN